MISTADSDQGIYYTFIIRGQGQNQKLRCGGLKNHFLGG